MLQGRTGTGCPSYDEEIIGQESAVIGEEGRSSSFKFFLIKNSKFKIPLLFIRVPSRPFAVQFFLFSSFFCLEVLCLLPQEGRLGG
jgi:hypothetical protein